MSIEAMKLALEALEMSYELQDIGWIDFEVYKFTCDADILRKLKITIDALKARLAQAEKQEPVAWGVDEGEGRCIDLHDVYFIPVDAEHMAELKGTHAKVVPLYIAPPQREWVCLTDGDVNYCVDAIYKGFDIKPRNEIEIEYFERVIKFVEAKLKEKNT